MPPPKRKSRERPWVLIFVLLSLIAHLLFVLAIVLISHFVPKPELKAPPQELASTTISLEQPPPATPPPPKPKRLFMPTSPDAHATHKEAPIESDNDSRLRSQSQEARDSTSIMPDVNVKRKHGTDLHDSPNAPNKPAPNPSAATAQKTPQQQQTSSQPPTPSTQTPTQTAQAQKTTPPSPSKEPSPTETKTPTPTVARQQFDPNGLPVLPALNAQTMAPPSTQQQASPVASPVEIAQNVRGALGTHGDNSPQAMATEFGRYKAKVYRAIGSRWHNYIDNQVQLIGVGMVHIQFTISADGTVETKVLEGDNGTLQLLLTASMNAIVKSAPFDPFSDNLRKEIAKEQGGDGSTYTDDCTFTVYGGGE